MKIEQENINFMGDYSDSPLPLTREGSASIKFDMEFNSNSDSGSFTGDEFTEDGSLSDTDEGGRLSRALQSWQPDLVVKTLEPREKPPLEPIYSGKLGNECITVPKQKYKRKNKSKPKSKSILKRSNSDDSIVTRLSLLTCSSGVSHSSKDAEILLDKRKRRGRKLQSRSSNSTEEVTESKWIALSKRKIGALNHFMKSQVGARHDVGIIAGEDDDDESEAFRMMDKDEQVSLYQTGYRRGVIYVNRAKLIRSSSCTAVDTNVQKPRTSVQRVMSASAKKSFGKPLDLEQVRRDRMNRLIAIEQAKQKEREHRQRKGSRKGSFTRTSSYKSTPGTGSQPGRPTSPGVSTVQSISLLSSHSSDVRPYSPSEVPEEVVDEPPISIWKGDRQIMEIDLNKELTHRVKSRITKTQIALKRATGLGENNEQKTIVGVNEEFPKHTEDDFCQKPRIIQKIRISPQLSGVIHNDIQVRMGRPRYHEIRTDDLQMWNKGQTLNRSHTNLKVFNWLHSLKEGEFTRVTIPEIYDDITNDEYVNSIELLHVESADEPDEAPLYRML